MWPGVVGKAIQCIFWKYLFLDTGAHQCHFYKNISFYYGDSIYFYTFSLMKL